VLATRNRSALLSRSLESVLGQTYRAWEVIVVDDRSTDDTTLVIDRRRVQREADPSDGSGVGTPGHPNSAASRNRRFYVVKGAIDISRRRR
jgi:glycosyltransferase involved in cell wall biosynthesis